MGKKSRVDWFAVRAAAHLDRIAHATMIEMGVPPSTIAERCRPGGPWTPRGRGVIGLTTGTSTPHQLIREALLYARDGSMVTGLAACRLYGLRNLPADHERYVHVLIDHERRRQSEGHVLVERTTRLPENPRTVSDFPVAPLPRALLDAARRMRVTSDVRALLTEAVQRGLVSPRQLRTELEEGSGRGTALVRRVVGEIEHGVRSVPEAEARDLAATDPRFDGMLWNPALERPGGAFLCRTDGYVEEVALAWEINSRLYHADLGKFEDTEARQADMTAAGVIVVTSTPREVRHRRRAALDHLVGGYELACQRPCPPVRVRR